VIYSIGFYDYVKVGLEVGETEITLKADDGPAYGDLEITLFGTGVDHKITASNGFTDVSG
jgi:hypothetical protein